MIPFQVLTTFQSQNKKHRLGCFVSQVKLVRVIRTYIRYLLEVDPRMKTLTGNNSPVLSDEEHLSIRKSILLPSVLTFAEQGLQELYGNKDLVNRPLSQLYVGCTKVIIQRIKADIRYINRALSSENIRVGRENVTQTSVTYRVIFRGQVNTFELTMDDARTEIGERLSGYIRNVVSDLTQKSASL
jgi:hypothetical protein